MGQNAGLPFGPNGGAGGRLTSQLPANLYIIFDNSLTSTSSNWLYYAPYLHNTVPVWDGSKWAWQPFFGCGYSVSSGTLTNSTVYDVFLSRSVLTPSSTNATTDVITFSSAHGLHSGAVCMPAGSGQGLVAGKLYTVRLDGTNPTTAITLHATIGDVSGATNRVDLTGSVTSSLIFLTFKFSAWASATVRSTDLAEDQGFVYLNGTKANTFLGTVRVEDFGGVTSVADSLVKRYIWNHYNRRPLPLQYNETTTSWTYATSAYRAANAGTNSPFFEYVQGLETDPLEVDVIVRTTSLGDGGHVGIGIDSTTVNSAQEWNEVFNNNTATMSTPSVAKYRGHPAQGYHKITWLEYRRSGTITFHGTNPTIALGGMAGRLFG